MLVVDPNHFATKNDWEVMRNVVRFAVEIKKEPAAQGADIDGFIQKEHMSTNHCSSTGWRQRANGVLWMAD
ncbi:hypothetical protein J3R82DRAFT_311 [Butyriboletus roseoflavus]|nr:hypothetical protein J3R82DRAFT_311 [Butyriboletus roseoflavus]